MIKTFPLEVGQTIYIEVANKYRPELPAKKMLVGTVAKIGRQYFYVKYNPRLTPIRFRKDTFESAPMYLRNGEGIQRRNAGPTVPERDY